MPQRHLLPFSLLFGLVLAAVHLLVPTAMAETTDIIESSVDSLEKALEMERHARFVDLRAALSPSDLAPFSTDGCSGGLSVGWEYLAKHIQQFQHIHGNKPPWEECCISHDLSYHLGGQADTSAEQSFVARRQADSELQQCVLETGLSRTESLGEAYRLSPQEVEELYRAISILMYRAVRIGGMPCTGLPWRWGYGWPECE